MIIEAGKVNLDDGLSNVLQLLCHITASYHSSVISVCVL